MSKSFVSAALLISNKYSDLLPLVPSIKAALERLPTGSLTHVAG